MANGTVVDRRVQRTRGLLHQALVSLIHEKPYDAIVVKEILGRANIGRSTFYAHFRDKSELLDSGLRDVLSKCSRANPTRAECRSEHLLRFSGPLFMHIDQFRSSAEPWVATKRHERVHERLHDALAAWVSSELAAGSPRVADRDDDAEDRRELLARHVAATFIVVLNWWMAQGVSMSAATANDRFRALIVPALRAYFGE